MVFLVFNRPDCTALSFAAIRAARPARLYVVADGPRPGRAGEAELCAATRAVVERGVDWPCDVIRDYAPVNLGLARRVSSGLEAVFSQETEAIILEDDCVADPTFFSFCAELLDRYRDEPRIGQIAGCTFQVAGDAAASYYFSRYPNCWGWATWRRAWRHFDYSMPSWQQAPREHRLPPWMQDPAERRYWEHSLDATARGRIDSWAYRWTWALWQHDCLSVAPYRNLVSNIGFGPAATHTRESTPLAGRPVSSMPFPLVHPGAMGCDSAADARTSALIYRRPSLLARLRRRVGRILAGGTA